MKSPDEQSTDNGPEHGRHYHADAGYNLVAGSFEVGGTLVNVNDVLLLVPNIYTNNIYP